MVETAEEQKKISDISKIFSWILKQQYYYIIANAYMIKKSWNRPKKCSQDFRYVMEMTGQTPPENIDALSKDLTFFITDNI